MHTIRCICVCEFRGRNSFKGEECKTRVNLNFFEKRELNKWGTIGVVEDKSLRL